MKVKEIMKKAFAVDKDLKLDEAAKIMVSKHVGSLIFLDEGEKVAGIVTESDLLKHFGKKGRIKEIMTSDVLTVTGNDEISDALEMMQENGIKKLPVLDKDGNLEGIITLADIAANASELGEEFLLD